MNPTRRNLLASTLAAPLGAFAQATRRHCPGCIHAADPEVAATGVAEMAVAQASPPKPVPLKKRPFPVRKEPGTWFNVLFGGEYWYKEREITYQILDAVRQVRPDVLHASLFGPELLGALPTGGQVVGVTPMSPRGVTTLREYLAWWKKVIDEAHRLGIKVQATFSMTLGYDTKAGDRGWFKYYKDLWETDVLGPRPVADPAELMQRDRLGRPLLATGGMKPDEYAFAGCPNNPYWRQLMKQFVKAGIKAGFDGFMVQLNYRFDCLCPYCQQAFRRYLAANHSPQCLRDRLGISDPATALLDTTRGRAPDLVPAGAQENDQPGPLEMEAWQFTSESLRQALEEVFLGYGRSLKPDLLVSSWMHHRGFLVPGVDYKREGLNPFNERILLPPERWGRGEDYIWYCVAPPKSNLREHNASDISLSAKFVYAMGGGKPFLIAKYDYVRPRLTLAEAWAQGGIGLALDRSESQDVLAPYFAFVHRHRDLYHPCEPYTELGLLFARRSMYRCDTSFLPALDRFARALLDGHGLFDVLIDQHLDRIALRRYRAVLLPVTTYLSPAERKQLEAYREAGGFLLVAGARREPGQPAPALAERVALTPEGADAATLAAFIRRTVGEPLSGCDAPWTVQMTVWRQPQARRLIVHLVNYDRDESVASQENPRATSPIRVRLNLPSGARLAGVRFVTPEQPDPQTLRAVATNGQALFQTPAFLVYGVAIVEYES
ncbi:MAG TPA: hypothetical protein VEU62_19665 [Bryobacterales bacterium]|nr:hypothetical protein [Bryobacterales bacterium]